MSSIATPTTPHLPITLAPADLGPDTVAEFTGEGILLVNTAAPVEDQLAAIADAATYLSTGQMSWGRPIRHLAVVK